MKKIFNHTKRPDEDWYRYGANNYDWDDWDDSEEPGETETDENEPYEDAEIVYSDEAAEYYEESPEGDAEYYAEETDELVEADELAEADAEDAVYYEEEPEAAEYYEEGVDGAAYYEDENGEYYAEDGEYYAEEEGEYYAEEGDEYYAEEDEDEWYEEIRPVSIRPERPKSFFAFIWEKFLEMGAMDRVVTVTGIVVLLLALVTGGVYVSGRLLDNQVSDMANVGSQLEGIGLIGEEGLMAVADAEAARQEAAEIVEEDESKGYDEEEYTNTVTVKLNMTSVMKDLKIKFTNKETSKLIGNVPFAVTITKPDGNTEIWSDDDKDGIIYKKDIDAGTYKVLVNELNSEKYENYTLPLDAQSVEVKKEIVYEKIDVSDEVKTESEIDVSQEDTKINETVVESTLQDTVIWVESTVVADTYTEVSKTTIPDPATLALSKAFMRTAAVTAPDVSGGDYVEPQLENVQFTASVTPVDVSTEVGAAVQARVVASGYTAGKTLKYSIVDFGDPAVATALIDQAGTISVTGVSAGSTTVTVSVDYAEGASFPVILTLNVTVKDKPVIAPVITLDKSTATVYLTETVTINATVSNAFTNTAVTAESSNTAVATVAVNDKAVTITGVTAGDATITVKYIENGQETQATCVVKVQGHPRDNQTDKLKDLSGNQLYVQENEQYREAVYADYYTASKFFIKGDAKYTGWQTIDGNVYYFTAAGEKVTGEQVIQGAKYNFASDGSLITGSGAMGIDVSRWNGNIDWNAVKNSGVSYVIIRCGYRGSSKGMLVVDPKFETNIKGAIDAGLKVGVYFFTQATDEIEAVEEASFVLDQIKNYKISYPVFLDVEPSGGRGDDIDVATRTAVCKAFCETIQRGGYTAGIYANKTWLTEKINTSSLSAYKIWLAQYAATPTYTGRYDMWQYTSKGKVSGIKGDVDLNLSYLGY